MWSNIGVNIGDKLAHLGESLTASAESHAKQRPRGDDEQQQTSVASTGGATVVPLPPPPAAFTPNPSLKEPRDYAKEILDREAGRTNDTDEMSLSKWTSSLAASFQRPPSQINNDDDDDNNNSNNSKPITLHNLKSWTDNVLSQTKHFVDETREAWEKEQARIQTAAPSLFH